MSTDKKISEDSSDEEDRPSPYFADYGRRYKEPANYNNTQLDEQNRYDSLDFGHSSAEDIDTGPDSDEDARPKNPIEHMRAVVPQRLVQALVMNRERHLNAQLIENDNDGRSPRDENRTNPQPDYLRETTYWKMTWMGIKSIAGFIAIIFSVGFDYYSIITDIQNFPNQPNVVASELIFLILSWLFSLGFAIRWYNVERNKTLELEELMGERDRNCPNCTNHGETSQKTVGCVLRYLANIPYLGHLPRKIDAIRYRIKHKKALNTCPCKELYFNKAKITKRNSAIIRVFDLIFEGAPTFIIQAYLILLKSNIDQDQYFSVISSAVMMPYSIVRWDMASDSREEHASKLRSFGRVISQFLWKLFEIVPRLIALAALMVLVGGWMIEIVLVHTLVLILWVIYCQYRKKEDEEEIDSSPKMANLYLVLLAMALNFFSVNTQLKGRTRNVKLIYYIVSEALNISVAVPWMLTQDMSNGWNLFVAIIIMGSIIPKIIFMLVYYKCCHPNREKVSEPLPKGYWSMCYYKKSALTSENPAANMNETEGIEETESVV